MAQIGELGIYNDYNQSIHLRDVTTKDGEVSRLLIIARRVDGVWQEMSFNLDHDQRGALSVALIEDQLDLNTIHELHPELGNVDDFNIFDKSANPKFWKNQLKKDGE